MRFGFAFKKKTCVNWSKLAMTIIMTLLGIVVLMPFFWMLSTSLKKAIDVFGFPVVWIPEEPQFNNYSVIWTNSIYPFYLFFLNSCKVGLLTTAGGLILCSTAAYAFAKINFKWKNVIFMMYLATLMIPQHVTLIPRFILSKWFGIYDTHLALILPAMFNMLGIFLLHQFFLSVPMEISESAKIDGASHFRIWHSIIMPLSKTAIASFVILMFVWSWNDYINPIIFLTNKYIYTIPIGLQVYKDDEEIAYNLIMAAASCAIIPVIAIFLGGQRYFIEGIATTGLKG